MSEALAGVLIIALAGLFGFAAYRVGQAHGRSEHNHRERLPDYDPEAPLITPPPASDDDNVVPLKRRKW